jgi:hypothetical protein
MAGEKTGLFARSAKAGSPRQTDGRPKKRIVDTARGGVVNIVKRLADGWNDLPKQVSQWTIKRILKQAGFRWQRVKKSLQSQQDPILYAFFKQEIAFLQQEDKQGKIRLVFYDEAGFSQNPASVYAWLPQHSTVSLPALRGNVLTIAGFMQSDNTLCRAITLYAER